MKVFNILREGLIHQLQDEHDTDEIIKDLANLVFLETIGDCEDITPEEKLDLAELLGVYAQNFHKRFKEFGFEIIRKKTGDAS